MEGSQESQDAGSAESAPSFGTVERFLILIFAACHKWLTAWKGCVNAQICPVTCSPESRVVLKCPHFLHGAVTARDAAISFFRALAETAAAAVYSHFIYILLVCQHLSSSNFCLFLVLQHKFVFSTSACWNGKKWVEGKCGTDIFVKKKSSNKGTGRLSPKERKKERTWRSSPWWSLGLPLFAAIHYLRGGGKF